MSTRLRRKLEEAFGAEEASFLMDGRPGGWSDLVTNQTLDLKIEALRADCHISETTKSMQRVSAATSSGSIAGNSAMRIWLRPSLR